MQSNSKIAAETFPEAKPVIWDYIPFTSLETDNRIGFENTELQGRLNGIIEKHNLHVWRIELMIYRAYLKKSVPFNTPEYDFYWRNQEEIKQHNKELKELKEFNRKGGTGSLEQLKLIYGVLGVNITSSSLINELFPDIKTIIDRIESLDYLTEIPDPDIKYKTSHGKKYTETILFPFFQFLSLEVLPEYTKIDRCRFIEEFIKTFELDITLIQSGDGQPFSDYLLHSFKRL